ncbi:MAG: class I SAM-dependent methyltransferase, partial [Chloroflexi bacterium]|nr:class I SAM-dependent methyltransferase [Chloroflexota bacterium]
MEQDLIAGGYDAVYAAVPNSPTLRRIWHESAEGVDFPEEFGHISFTTVPELERMASELRLNPGDTLVDLGCGMAGPALWMARETGAHLIGVDASRVATEQAAARAKELGLGEQARFVVGSYADTGIEAGSADGAMSEDALQYAPDKEAAMAEVARILRPGGRFVFTAYELDPERAAGLPILGDNIVENFRPALEKAGFAVTTYEEVPGWPEPMTATYSAVVGAREALMQEMGEAATNVLLL